MTFRTPIKYVERRGNQISVRGSRIMRVRCSILDGAVCALVLVRAVVDADTSGGGMEQVALTGAELGSKTDNYQTIIPSVDLDFRDCDGLPLGGEGGTLALSLGTGATYSKASASAHWQVWYLETDE